MPQVPRGALEGFDLNPDLAIDHVTNAGNYGVLVNIQSGAMSVKNFHDLSSCAAGVEPLS
jgi:hypothetical protein